MSIESGRKLGHYEVLEPIGKGGMGEVYRAKDTKLGRDVAIKVLPDEFAADEERLRRFQREAKVLAALNHPNIAAIYGLEQSEATHYLVLELVPGETLAERIARGPIPVDEALEIASKIVDALEEAHEQGIVHRDLKPANIKLTDDGKVKVLDFGLAKAFVEETSYADSSMSPTITRDATRAGVILGTAAYMSPEQAKGKKVDRRADIWAFGAVLFEMLTGERAFAAEDVSETLAYVLTKEPQWSSLPEATPIALRQSLRVCLVKDPRRRMRDIGDVRLAMDGTFEQAPQVISRASDRRPWRAIVAALAFAILAGAAAWFLKPELPRQVAKFRLSFPLGVPVSGSGVDLLAVAPDGRKIIYVAGDQLYLHAIDQMEAVPVRGTEGARVPFFSPDGEWLGFFAGGRLKRVPIAGGTAVSLSDAQIHNVWGAHWSDDDAIVFSERGVGILSVSANGGKPEMLIPLDPTVGFADSPQVLPGGNAVLFTLGDGANWDDAQIVVQSPGSTERKVLVDGGRDGRYVRSGHLAYVREGTLFAVPFDLDRLETTGSAVPVAEGVLAARGFSAAAYFSVSDSGALVYISGDSRQNRTLVWVDRAGTEEPLDAPPRAYTYPRISPDGSQLALDVRDQDDDIWVWHFTRKTLTRFTFNPGMDQYPVWSPDGGRLAFASTPLDGLKNLYSKSADGTGADELMTQVDTAPVPFAYSPDGSRLVFRQYDIGLSLDIGMLSGDGSVEPLIATAYGETNAEVSPDGGFIAYQSDESGRDEIYVRPFPNVEDGRWQVSTDGGTRPLWAPGGQELFYLATDAGLVATRVQTEPGFALNNTETLFDASIYVGVGASPGRTYDISPDGERFLMVKEADQRTSSVELVFVLNWFEELQQLVPTDD